MKTIGVRELRQRASKYLRLVEAGETIEITDRGRPVALLTAIPTASRRHRLESEGQLSPADGDILDLGPPLPPAEGVPTPSEALAEARRDER